MSDDYERARHSVTKLHVHLSFTTKYRRKEYRRKEYRRKVMAPEVLESVFAALRIISRSMDVKHSLRARREKAS
ncbi:MAG: hypothetical protein KHY61_09500 [Sutterella wadsworthensis]|nr:hypothetical protein [Sutterella wadsworthensis]